MTDLLLDISVVPDPSASIDVLAKICECFVHLHSGRATQTRVAIRQLADLIRDLRPGAIFRSLGTEMTFEAFVRFGDAAAAIDLIEAERLHAADAECAAPPVGGGTHRPRRWRDGAVNHRGVCPLGAHHSTTDHSLLLLVRSAAHELLGDTAQADEFFEEAC